mmetsp:Transcript_53844/g.166849  ORF Transcript_53844/g.166849 Transcript_53844/m.166849 type:complete len:214 (+) Transcript_53844:53-694(+)
MAWPPPLSQWTVCERNNGGFATSSAMPAPPLTAGALLALGMVGMLVCVRIPWPPNTIPCRVCVESCLTSWAVASASSSALSGQSASPPATRGRTTAHKAMARMLAKTLASHGTVFPPFSYTGPKAKGPRVRAIFPNNVICPMASPKRVGFTTQVMSVWILVSCSWSPKTTTKTNTNMAHLPSDGMAMPQKPTALSTPPNAMEPFRPVSFCTRV